MAWATAAHWRVGKTAHDALVRFRIVDKLVQAACVTNLGQRSGRAMLAQSQFRKRVGLFDHFARSNRRR